MGPEPFEYHLGTTRMPSSYKNKKNSRTLYDILQLQNWSTPGFLQMFSYTNRFYFNCFCDYATHVSKRSNQKAEGIRVEKSDVSPSHRGWESGFTSRVGPLSLAFQRQLFNSLYFKFCSPHNSRLMDSSLSDFLF